MEKHRSQLDAMYLYFFRMRFLSSVLGDFWMMIKQINWPVFWQRLWCKGWPTLSVGFDRPFTKGAQQTRYRFLCVLLSHAFMVRLGGARLRALISFCISLSTLLVLPPLFDSNLVRLLLITKGIVNHDAIYCALFPCTFSAFSAFHSHSFIARFRCVLIDSRNQLTAASILVSGVLCWIKIMKFIAQLILVVLIAQK